MKTALKYGIILGVVSILSTLAMYLINPELLFNMKIGLAVGLIFTIAILVLALKEERKINEGILSFGDGLKTTFVAYAIGSLFSALFMYTLMNHIDPSLIDRGVEYGQDIAEATLNYTADMFDMPESEKDKALEEIRSPEAVAQMRSNFGFSSNMINFLIILIFPGFLYWLIIPAIMKKDPGGA